MLHNFTKSRDIVDLLGPGNLKMNEVILADCLQAMAEMPDNSFDLILTDPPYFKVKKEWWDRQWEKPEGFLAWIDQLAQEWQRILKPNGSLYCFASPRMAARVEVKLGDRFNIVNHLVWDKDGRSRAAMTCKEESRGYFPESERIIFCEHYGADNIAKGEAGYGAKCDDLRGFVFEPLRAYLDGERAKLGLSSTPFDGILGTNGLCKKYFNYAQWQLPTEKGYKAFQQAFPGYFTRPYEELRQQYEELRRPFSVTADVPYTDVWTFPTVNHYPGKHPCEKPQALLRHVISVSTRPSALVLDSFAGSGATLVAAKALGRNYIGVEIDPHWVDVARKNLNGVNPIAHPPNNLLRFPEKKKPEALGEQLSLPLWDTETG